MRHRLIADNLHTPSIFTTKNWSVGARGYCIKRMDMGIMASYQLSQSVCRRLLNSDFRLAPLHKYHYHYDSVAVLEPSSKWFSVASWVRNVVPRQVPRTFTFTICSNEMSYPYSRRTEAKPRWPNAWEQYNTIVQYRINLRNRKTMHV